MLVFNLKIDNVDRDCFIYFLLQLDQVVYVGKTMTGLSRPFSHKDKVFDSVGIIYCDPHELATLEADFILKYKPKYNKAAPYELGFIKARNYIRNSTCNEDYTLTDLKKAIERLDIPVIYIEFKPFIAIDDIKRIAEDESISSGGGYGTL